MDIGAQLYIYRKTFDLERENDLSAICAGLTGYSGVEGFLGSRFDYRRLLDAHGLRYHGVHLVTAELSDPTPVVAYLRTMGGADVCVSGPLRWNERTADDYRRTADFLNGVGHRLRGDGVFLHYHNHDFEFAPPISDGGGETAMRILLDGFNPEAVTLCADLGWIYRAGGDPVAFLRDHAGRIGYVHLRDFRGAESVPLGKGEVDLSAQLALLPSLPGVRHVVVEQDPTTPTPAADMRHSRDHLRRLTEVGAGA